MAATADDSQFKITVHSRERIVEVRYPPHPNAAAVERYARDIRAAIQRLGGRWKCLVDQTALTLMPPELTPTISELNHWALEHGMERTARVVKRTAISEMQARRIFREGGVAEGAQLFDSREEAWRSLVGDAARPG